MDNDLRNMLIKHEKLITQKARKELKRKRDDNRERRNAEKFANSLIVNAKNVTEKINDVKDNIGEMIKKLNKELELSRQAQKNSKKDFDKRDK